MADINVTKIGFVILIGLPGSGKTTFSEYLTDSLENSCNIQGFEHIPPYHIINVCYDKLIPWSIHIEKHDDARWHEVRKTVLNMVEKLVCNLKSLPISEYEKLKRHDDLSLFMDYSKLLKNPTRILIVLDDNMYYRSMRYQYYQLARYYGLGFSQVYIQCDLDEALKRNAMRNEENFVAEEVIRRMVNHLEPPNISMQSWEEYSCLISSSEPFDSRTLVGVYDMIQKSLADPVLLLQDNSEEKETEAAAARSICSTNVIHQVDLVLRKIIGNEMNNNQSVVGGEQLKVLAKSLNTSKQLLLEDVKSGKIMIPEQLCSAVECHNPQASLLLYEFMCGHFQKTRNC